MSIPPSYKYVTTWVQNYGSGGIPDQRAVQDFMDCETQEQVRLLQQELQVLMSGNYNEDSLDKLIGIARKTRHTTFEEWAKHMMQWIAAYKG